MIDKLNLHYAFENPASVYDEEALTALELAGRQGAKINELVEAQNTLRQETEEHLNNQDTTIEERMDSQDERITTMNDVTMPKKVEQSIQAHIASGDFDAEIEEHLGGLVERVDNIIANIPEGGTAMDAEVVDIRVRANGDTHTNAGGAVRAIDEDLQNFKADSSGVVTLFDGFIGVGAWDSNGLSPHLNGNVLTTPGGIGSGFASPTFIPKGNQKMYFRIGFTCSRAEGTLKIYIADGVTTNSNFKMLADITPGEHIIEIDPTLYDFNINRVWVVQNTGVTDAELTYIYTLNKFNLYHSLLRERGFESDCGIEYILEQSSRIDNMENVLNENRILFDGVSNFVLWGTNTKIPDLLVDAETDTAYISSIRGADYNAIWDAGFATPLLQVDPAKTLRVGVDVVLSGSADYNLQLYLSNADYTTFKSLAVITSSGHYEYEIDPAYYAVYGGLPSIDRIMFVHHAKELTFVDTAISNVDIHQNRMEDAGLASTLGDAVLQINSKVNNLGHDSDVLVAPNNKRYLLQVTNEGGVVGVPVIPGKTLYLGNSILCGYGEFGMAASNGTSDYYYLINQAIAEENSAHTSERLRSNPWENATTIEAQNEFLNTTLLPHLSNDLELVIIQLGDNVNTSERLAVLREGSKNLIQFIRSHCPKARVVWVGVWYQTSEKVAMIKDSCVECGIQFIDISDLNVAENQSYMGAVFTFSDGSTKVVEDAGVASHPGDKGMKKIANRVLYHLGVVSTENYYQ